MITGSQHEHLPIAAFASPVAGIVATAFASVFVAGSPGR
jgi:3-isopropylmalate dehydratase small subunit